MLRLRPALKKINCVSCEIVIFSQFAISQIRNFPQSILQPDEQPDRHRMSTVSPGSHMNRLAVRRALSLRRLTFPEDLF